MVARRPCAEHGERGSPPAAWRAPPPRGTRIQRVGAGAVGAGGGATRARDVTGPAVAAREREQRPVGVVEPRVRKVTRHQLVEVLRAGVDVRLDRRDVAHAEHGAGGRHHLHHADGTDVAARGLVERRLLESLCGEHQRGEVVALAVLAEQRERRLEAPPLLAGGGLAKPLRPLRVARVAHVGHVLLAREVAVERLDLGGEPRAAVADRPAHARVAAQHDVLADGDLRLRTRPDPGLPVVDDDRPQQAGGDHVHHVLVLERVGREDDPDCAAHVDGPPGETVDVGHARAGGAGDRELLHRRRILGGDEVGGFAPLRRHRRGAGGDVAEPPARCGSSSSRVVTIGTTVSGRLPRAAACLRLR